MQVIESIVGPYLFPWALCRYPVFLLTSFYWIFTKTWIFLTGTQRFATTALDEPVFLRSPKLRLNVSSKNSPNLELYNILRTSIKLLNYNYFKLKIKRVLLQHCFYSTDEFMFMSNPVNLAALEEYV